MDNDKHVDIITVNSLQNAITVHYFQPADMSFKPSTPIPFEVINNERVHKISSIIISKDMQQL